MDRGILLQHLALVEEHIQMGARSIERQQEVIDKLVAHGHDTVEARRMLKKFQEHAGDAFCGPGADHEGVEQRRRKH